MPAARSTAPLLLAALLQACQPAQQAPPPAAPSADAVPVGGSPSAAASDREFLTQAAIDGRFEVAVGTLAQERAQDDAVRDFAGTVAARHARLNEALEDLARDRGLRLPGQLDRAHQQQLDMLQRLQGTEFDRRFVEEVGIYGHARTVALFDEAAQRAQDPALRSWFAQSLPVLRLHEQQARTLAAGDGHRPPTAGLVSAAASRGPRP